MQPKDQNQSTNQAPSPATEQLTPSATAWGGVAPAASATTQSKASGQPVGKVIGLVVGIIILAAGAGFGGAALFRTTTHTLETNTIATTIESEGEAIAEVAQKVGDSVVSIVTSSQAYSEYSFYFGGDQQVVSGAGTGVIISKDGYIVTNKHVVPDNVTSVSVILRDGTEFDAKVAGRDPLNDIAFLKIDGADDLQPAALGESGKVAVGTKVVAIGNALGQYQTSVTSGIVSGIGRTITASSGSGSTTETLSNLLQTDAAINPGNSGGPLVTFDGKVIGITTAIVENAQGLGFAIPIDDTRGVIESVLSTGKVTRAYLGVRYINLTPSVAKEYKLEVENGAYLGGVNGSAVITGSPADKAGLKNGDIIIKVGDQDIDASHQLFSLTNQYKVGDKVKLTVLRGSETLTLSAELAAYEAD